MNELISIIIPIYNSEKYLPKCIESLRTQSYRNIEIILVNDGSTDGCAEICDEYQKKDDRIKVYHKKNEGVAAARNDGLDLAKGKYITFVDSDDFVSVDYCEKLLITLQRNEAQIAICRIHDFKENDEIIMKDTEYMEDKFNSEETISNLIIVERYYNCMGGKLFLRDLFDNVRFPVGRVYEDAATMYKLYKDSNFIVVLNQEYYFYLRQREGSITTSVYGEKNQKDDYLLISEKYKYLKENFPQIKELVVAGYIRDIMNVVQSSYLSEIENLLDTEVLRTLEKDLIKLIQEVDKNILEKVLNVYKTTCLYLYLQNKKMYAQNIKELYRTRHDNDKLWGN